MSAIADQMQAQKALMLLSTTGQAATQLLMLLPGFGNYTGQLILCTLHSITGAHNFPTFDASTMVVCPSRYSFSTHFVIDIFPLILWGSMDGVCTSN